MKRIRIVCKTPAQPENKSLRIYPDARDTHVFVVNEDGTEEELDGVSGVSWSVDVNDTARATVRFVGVEVDIETVADLEPPAPKVDDQR